MAIVPATALGLVTIPKLVELPDEDKDDLTNKSVAAQAAINRNFNVLANKIVSKQTSDDRAWTTYTPSWGGTVTPPAIGNGQVVGAYRKDGKSVAVRIHVVPGTTTTFGAGIYSLTLPTGLTSIVTYEQILTCKIWTPGANYTGAAYIGANSTIVWPLFGNPAGNWTPAAPGAFANGGNFTVQGVYECQ